MRQEAIPIKQLWDQLLGREIEMKVFEDNQGAIDVTETGYSPNLRYLLKTQKVSIDLNHTFFHGDKEKDVDPLATIEYIETEKQVADIFTKALQPHAWQHALNLLHVERQEKDTAAGVGGGL